MKKFKNIAPLMILIFFIGTTSAQSSPPLTASDKIDILKAFDKQKKIILTVNNLQPEEIPAKPLIDDYKQQEKLIKKYESTKNPTAIKIINDKTKEMYNSIPNIDKAIQKLNPMQTALKTNVMISEPLKTSPQLLIQEKAQPTLTTATKIKINNNTLFQAPSHLLTEKQQSLLTAAPKTTLIAASALESLPQLLLKQEQPIGMNELKELFAQLEKQVTQELKQENKPIYQPASKSITQKTSQQPLLPIKAQTELATRLAQLEIELYKKFYYNETKELLTKEGIKDIIKTIQTEQPSISSAQLINIAHTKAIELLTAIKKQNQLDAQSKLLLLQMINDEIDKQKQTKISSYKAPVFTGALKELEIKRPMTEYHDITPTSFTSTIEPISSLKTKKPKIKITDDPIIQEPKTSLLPNNLMQFVEYSKKQASNYYYSNGTIAQSWLTKAVGHILNGMFTNNKKEDIVQKLFAMVDMLVAAPLRDDTSITDDEYAKIVAKLENTVKKFVDTLVVDKIYRPAN